MKIDIDNELDNLGRNALMVSSYYGRYGIVDVLLKNGANVNYKNEFGMTPLRMAISGYYDAWDGFLLRDLLDVMVLLLQKGAIIDDVTFLAAKSESVREILRKFK
jgi:ankyrin repeat protein